MYPAVKNINKFCELIEVLTYEAVPKKFTYRYLASLGFSSSADRELLSLLKLLGFLTEKGTPTQRYFDMRDKNKQKVVLQDAVVSIYREIIDANHSIENLSLNGLTDIFRTATGVDRETAQLMAFTFLRLKECSDLVDIDWFFDHEEYRYATKLEEIDELREKNSIYSKKQLAQNDKKISKQENVSKNANSFVNNNKVSSNDNTKPIQIQLVLPETSNEKVYEAIFKHLAKYLK